MTFADKVRYDRIVQQVTHKGGEFSMYYIKIFQNTQALSVSVVNTYSEDQLMHKFLDSFHQCGKDPSSIASHQSELRRESKLTDQKSIPISFPQTNYLKLEMVSLSNHFS